MDSHYGFLIVVVTNHISVSFYGIPKDKSYPIGNKASFWVLLQVIVSNQKNDDFCSSCRIQPDKNIPLRLIIFWYVINENLLIFE